MTSNEIQTLHSTKNTSPDVSTSLVHSKVYSDTKLYTKTRTSIRRAKLQSAARCLCRPIHRAFNVIGRTRNKAPLAPGNKLMNSLPSATEEFIHIFLSIYRYFNAVESSGQNVHFYFNCCVHLHHTTALDANANSSWTLMSTDNH